VSFTRLIVAAVLMAGLGGVLYWSNKSEKAKEGAPAKDAPPAILTLKEADIKQVEIDRKSGDATVAKKDDSGKWQIIAPRALPADQSAINGITGAVSSLKSERLVDDNATDLASYGLAPARITAKITTADGKTSTLLIGEDTAAGGSVFAKLEGDPKLYTVASYTKDQLDKGLNNLRDRHLMTFDRDKTSRVELDVARQTPLEFGRISMNEWQILKPKPMRADGFQVEDLLSRVKEAEMDASLSDEAAKQNASKFASGQLVAKVTATDPSGAQTLEVHKSGDDFFAKSSAIEGVNKISADLGKLLDKKLDDFRNKKLFDFGFNDPTRIEYKDGSKTAAYEKSGDNWVSGGKNMDSVSVQALIDKLRDLSASKFVETGFTTPAIELTVVSDSGKRTEKVQISQAGKDYIAKRENEASLYQLDAMTVEDLRKAANDVKEAQPQAKK
jgi:uncharacterized protein DUF4340